MSGLVVTDTPIESLAEEQQLRAVAFVLSRTDWTVASGRCAALLGAVQVLDFDEVGKIFGLNLARIAFSTHMVRTGPPGATNIPHGMVGRIHFSSTSYRQRRTHMHMRTHARAKGQSKLHGLSAVPAGSR